MNEFYEEYEQLLHLVAPVIEQLNKIKDKKEEQINLFRSFENVTDMDFYKDSKNPEAKAMGYVIESLPLAFEKMKSDIDMLVSEGSKLSNNFSMAIDKLKRV